MEVFLLLLLLALSVVFFVMRKAAIKAFSRTVELPQFRVEKTDAVLEPLESLQTEMQESHQGPVKPPQVDPIKEPKGLNKLSLDELTQLPDWMVPPGRKTELNAYKARKRRGIKALKSSEEENDAIKAARMRAGLRSDGSKPDRRGTSAPNNESTEKLGPRGGRYTEARTKNGRPYRRYF